MAIDRLALSNFRNHADALIVPDASMIVLTGENGAGKTNILEAISLLAPGRGLRGAALRDMARQDGPGGFAVSARLGDIQIGTGADAGAPDKRLVRIEGRTAPANSLSGKLALSWLTPAMDRLFLDSPGSRRRFLDRLVLAHDPGHAHHSARYEAAMRARNTLLAEEGPIDAAWLAALEARMAEHGAAIDAARRALIVALEQEIDANAQHLFARPLLALSSIDMNEGDLFEKLKSGRNLDRSAGRTLVGPHRSDLLVRHFGKDQEASVCSTGEQKALLLSIILAHAQLVGAASGRPLIILLDEVGAHLDARRRQALFDRLRATGGQVWMTGTEAALFEGLEQATYLNVEAGRIIPTDIQAWKASYVLGKDTEAP